MTPLRPQLLKLLLPWLLYVCAAMLALMIDAQPPVQAQTSPARRLTDAQRLQRARMLERDYHRDLADKKALVELSRAYLEAGYPALTVVTIRSASPALLDDPQVGHELARAYEQSGQPREAVDAADRATAACRRAFNAPDPAFPNVDCNERNPGETRYSQARARAHDALGRHRSPQRPARAACL